VSPFIREVPTFSYLGINLLVFLWMNVFAFTVALIKKLKVSKRFHSQL